MDIVFTTTSEYKRCFSSAANKVTAKCPELTDEPDSKSNNTALHVAALNNRTEIATILLVQVSFKSHEIKNPPIE